VIVRSNCLITIYLGVASESLLPDSDTSADELALDYSFAMFRTKRQKKEQTRDVSGDTIGRLIGRGHNSGTCLREMHACHRPCLLELHFVRSIPGSDLCL
jgi:hypothetical protein